MASAASGYQEHEPLSTARQDYDSLQGPKCCRPSSWSQTRRRGVALLTIIVVVMIVIIVAVSSKSASDASSDAWKTLRLPSGVRPNSYHLTLQTNLTNFNFQGQVAIDLAVTQSTSSVWLHALALDVVDVTLVSSGGTAKPTSQFHYETNEFYVMTFANELVAGTAYTLNIQFNGNLTDRLAGFYRSSYFNDAGVKRWIATTQFEATDARRAFPCFDEPAMKANFTLTMIIDPDMVALGNMPQTSSQILPSGLKQVDFAPSVKMSTYLVAFIVCDFVSIDGATDKGTIVRVWAPVDKISQASVALDAGVKIIRYYETYFNVPYPLPKQDMVAIPDFAAGAMENWGLITYRETALLYDPKESSSSDQQRVVVVVAHELAHQWFGNYVTMDWWSGLWLNEGFASYVEYVGTHSVHPEWDMWSQFTYSSQQIALQLDSSLSSHPVLQDVGNPSEINELFDSISYDKGASLIRMMVDFLGEEAFLKGLKAYLDAHSFGNANSNDLWIAMSNATSALGRPMDVISIMQAWTLKMGYPYLQITESSAGSLTAVQHRFLANGGTGPLPEYKWDISINSVTDTGESHQIWLWRDDESATLTTTLPSTSGWFKADANETGYYRVNYPPQYWDRLEAAMVRDDARLGAPDRMGLIDDAFALAHANIIPITQALNMTTGLSRETSFNVWTVAANHLVSLDYLLRTQPDYNRYLRYISSLVSGPLATVGWNGTDGGHTTRLLRGTIVGAATRWHVGTARATALALFNAYMNDPVANYIVPDLRDAIYTVGVAEGGEPAWLFIYNRYKTTKVQAESRRCMRALSYTREPWLLNRLLAYSLNKDEIRVQDTITVISYVGNNVIGEPLAWQFLKDNWKELYNRYGAASFQFAGLVQSLTQHFRTSGAREDVVNFFNGKELGSAKRAVEQSLEVIDRNIAWLSTNYNTVIEWLIAHA